MTVNIKTTSKKYRGKKAATYDAIRIKQVRWDEENRIVGLMLTACKPANVLDVPVGTGRFLSLYAALGIKFVDGVDVSEEMLALARKKKIKPEKLTLKVGDASALDFHDKSRDVVVCVRFLDLIDQEAMHVVVGEMCRVAKRAIICTIRFGKKYVPKSNTAEHDEKKFTALVAKLGWKITEKAPIFKAGWHVVMMERK